MKRGEVWLVNLDPTIGAELHKTRPGILVSSDLIGILPLRVIVPLTDWKDRYGVAPWLVRIEPDPANGLTKTSAADCFQMRSISINRLVRKIGQVTAEEMERIVEGIQRVIGE